jgi:hypothetical protein
MLRVICLRFDLQETTATDVIMEGGNVRDNAYLSIGSVSGQGDHLFQTVQMIQEKCLLVTKGTRIISILYP